jgi:hypothetical protein
MIFGAVEPVDNSPFRRIVHRHRFIVTVGEGLLSTGGTVMSGRVVPLRPMALSLKKSPENRAF